MFRIISGSEALCIVHSKGGLSTVISLNLENSPRHEPKRQIGGAHVYKQRGEHESDQSISVSTELASNGTPITPKVNRLNFCVEKNIFVNICNKKKSAIHLKMKEYLVYSCLVSVQLPHDHLKKKD